jgi:hypothetical protein
MAINIHSHSHPHTSHLPLIHRISKKLSHQSRIEVITSSFLTSSMGYKGSKTNPPLSSIKLSIMQIIFHILPPRAIVQNTPNPVCRFCVLLFIRCSCLLHNATCSRSYRQHLLVVQTTPSYTCAHTFSSHNSWIQHFSRHLAVSGVRFKSFRCFSLHSSP